MDEHTFTRNIDMLIAGTKQYRTFGPEKKAAYWKVFERYPDQSFVDACNRLLATEEEMPSIPRLLQELKIDKPAKPQDCPECDMGMILFTVSHDNGQQYDHYAACNKCDAGHARAEHMMQMARKRALSRSEIPPPHDINRYYWQNIRPNVHKRLVADDQPPAISGAWDVEEGSQGAKNAFLEAIGKKGEPWDMGDDEKEFRKEDD